jgi:hypothetical protein
VHTHKARLSLLLPLLVLFPVAPSSGAAPVDPPAELLEEPYLYEVIQHLYRWYMDEIDVVRATRDLEKPVTLWVRGLRPELDPGDQSRFGRISIPVVGISVKVKKADYRIEKLGAVVTNNTFKIINVARSAIPDTMPPGSVRVDLDRQAMRAHLFRMRAHARYPDAELLERLRRSVRRQIAGHEDSVPEGDQVVHISPLSPVANELWVYWETGRVLVRFASDIDLANPAVWEHEDLAVELYDIDEQVVVSLEEVAGSNAYLTRDQVGRALYNCVVLGHRLVLQPEQDLPASVQ